MAWGDIYKNEFTGELCKHFPCHTGQLDILNSEARYVAAIGGVNSGKTVLECVWLAQEISRLGGDKQYLVVGPKYDIVTTATMDAFCATVKGTVLEGHDVRSNTNPYYQLGTGGKVYFRSANASFEGLKPWAAIFDEAGDCPYSIFTAIQRRLAGRSGRICIGTTPYLAYDWLQTEFIAKADAGDENYFYRIMPSVLNPTFSAADIEEARKSLEPWEMEMFYEGKFSKPPGQVYNLLDYTGQSVIVEKKLADLDLAGCSGIFGGIDWGGADPTAILLAAMYPDKSLIVFCEEYHKGQDIGQVLTRLEDLDSRLEKIGGKKIKWLFCDHSPDRILLLYRSGWRGRVMPVKKGPQSIPIGISLVRNRFRSGTLKIVKGQCPNLQKELIKYRYPTVNGQVVGNKPIPGDDHALDALSYLVRGIDKREFDKLARYHDDGQEYKNQTSIDKWVA